MESFSFIACIGENTEFGQEWVGEESVENRAIEPKESWQRAFSVAVLEYWLLDYKGIVYMLAGIVNKSTKKCTSLIVIC